jgi:quercetin dioxygenase-like cupin family protein
MEATSSPVPQPYVLNPGEGEAFWYVNNRATLKASATATGGQFSLVEMVVAPGHGPPLHIHRAEDEALWVLEGQFTFQIGDDLVVASPGTFVFQPRGVPHTFRLDGIAPGKLLVLLIPGGGEGFFIAGGRPAAAGGLPPPSVPDVAQVATAAATYHIAFVGPPLAPEPPNGASTAADGEASPSWEPSQRDLR